MTKLTKAEREELRKIIAEARDVCHCGQYVDEHTVSDNHAALAMDTQESDRLTAASLEAMPRLLADLDAAEAERDQLKQTQCGIMHFVDKWLDELDEVDEPTEDPVSRSMRAREIALKWGEGIAAERDALKAKLAALVEALESVVQRAGCRRGMNAQELRGLLWGCEDDAKAAIAAARGGAQ